jgi:hypothetical protein
LAGTFSAAIVQKPTLNAYQFFFGMAFQFSLFALLCNYFVMSALADFYILQFECRKCDNRFYPITYSYRRRRYWQPERATHSTNRKQEI